jgi:MFS family permease
VAGLLVLTLASAAAFLTAQYFQLGLGYSPLVIAGVGVSMALPAVPTAALSAVPPGDVGLASGVINTLQRFGAACGIALVTAVFAAHGHLGSVSSFTAGYRPAMGVSAAISLLGAAAAVAIGRRQAAPVPAVVPERVPARRPG